jgi:hypothetical protein
MDKEKDGSRWGRKREERHGKFTDIKDSKNLHGFPN